MKRMNFETVIMLIALIAMMFVVILYVTRSGPAIENPTPSEEAPVTVNGVFYGSTEEYPLGNGPEIWGTPLDPDEIRMEDVFNTYTVDEYEVNVKVRYSAVYDKPYGGKIIGYVIAEDFDTERLLHANYSPRIGLYVEELTGIYTGENGIHNAVFPEVDIVWLNEDDAGVSLGIVPHPERYDNVDFGS